MERVQSLGQFEPNSKEIKMKEIDKYIRDAHPNVLRELGFSP